jgi:[ribosomal protein S5]-alanine N-acetyltransferase
VKYGFEDLGLLRIWAEVFEGNTGSMRVLAKADFQQEGMLRNSVFKDGRVLNSTRFAVIK